MERINLAAELRKPLGFRTEVPLPKLKAMSATRIERLEEGIAMATAALRELPLARLADVSGSRNTFELMEFLENLLER